MQSLHQVMIKEKQILEEDNFRNSSDGLHSVYQRDDHIM